MRFSLSRPQSAPPVDTPPVALPHGPLTGDLPSAAEEAAMLADPRGTPSVDEARAAYQHVVRLLVARRARQNWLVAGPEAALPELRPPVPSGVVGQRELALGPTGERPREGEDDGVQRSPGRLPTDAALATTPPPLPDRTMLTSGAPVLAPSPPPSDGGAAALAAATPDVAGATARPTATPPVAPNAGRAAAAPAVPASSASSETATPATVGPRPGAWAWDSYLAHRLRLAEAQLARAIANAETSPVPPQIVNLVGGQAAFAALPELAVPAHYAGTEPLRQLQPSDVPAPLMRGCDEGRTFIAIRYYDLLRNVPGLVVLAQVLPGQAGTQDWCTYNPQRFAASVTGTRNTEPRLLGLRYDRPERLPPAPDARHLMRALAALVQGGGVIDRHRYRLTASLTQPTVTAPSDDGASDAGDARTTDRTGLGDIADADVVDLASIAEDANDASEASDTDRPRGRDGDGDGDGDDDDASDVATPTWATTAAAAAARRQGGLLRRGSSSGAETALAATPAASRAPSVAGTPDMVHPPVMPSALGRLPSPTPAYLTPPRPLSTAPSTPSDLARSIQLDEYPWRSDVETAAPEPPNEVPSDFSASSDTEARFRPPQLPAPKPVPEVDSGSKSSAYAVSPLPRPTPGLGRAAALRLGLGLRVPPSNLPRPTGAGATPRRPTGASPLGLADGLRLPASPRAGTSGTEVRTRGQRRSPPVPHSDGRPAGAMPATPTRTAPPSPTFGLTRAASERGPSSRRASQVIRSRSHREGHSGEPARGSSEAPPVAGPAPGSPADAAASARQRGSTAAGRGARRSLR